MEQRKSFRLAAGEAQRVEPLMDNAVTLELHAVEGGPIVLFVGEMNEDECAAAWERGKFDLAAGSNTKSKMGVAIRHGACTVWSPDATVGFIQVSDGK